MMKIITWKAVYEDPPVVPDDKTNPDPKPESKTFTQDQLNKILAEERRKYQASQQKLLSELENLKGTFNLTEEQKAKLEETAESLRNELLTKEQLAAKEKEKLATEHKKQLESATADAKKWQALFETTTIDRHLMDAAIKNKAFNPSHIMALLRGSTKIVDDGEGNFVPKVKLASKDKDGKAITLEFTAEEAVKYLSEQEENRNLFRGEGTGGVGASNHPGNSGKIDVKQLAKDPVAYREWRKKNPHV